MRRSLVVGISLFSLCLLFCGPAVAKEFLAQTTAVNVDSECDAVAGNLVTNCGFETGDFTGWTRSGDPSFTGVSGGIYTHTGSFGLQAGPIDPSMGFITQNLATNAGGTYTLSLWVRNFLRPNRLQISWNGVVISDAVDLDDFGYTLMTFGGLVASDGDTTELKIGFYNDPDYIGIDDIEVVPSL